MKHEVTYAEVVAALRADGSCIGVVADPDAYHAWKAELEAEFGCPVVSKSVLSEFAAGSYQFHWNKQHGGRKETAGMRLGSMVDCLVLTPDRWQEKYTRPWEPTGKYAKPWEPCEEKRFKLKQDGTPSKTQDPEQKEAWEKARERFEAEKAAQKAAFEADCEERGRVVLKDGEQERADEIAAVAKYAMEEMGLVLGKTCASQVGMWVYLEEVGGEPLPCPVIVTGMIDILPDDDCVLNGEILDLKTTSSDVTDATRLFWAIEDYMYGIQAAMYLDLFNLCEGAESPRERFGFLFVGSSRPAMSRLVMMDATCIAAHRLEYFALLRRYCATYVSGEWGSPQLDDVWYVPTRKAAAKIQEALTQEGVGA